MDCSPPGSSVHGILQARTLEWLPFPSPGDLLDPGMETACPTSADRFFTTGPPVKVSDSHSVMSIEFCRPEYRSGWPFPSPGHLPNPGIDPRSPALQVDSLPSEPPGKPKNTGVGSLSLLQYIFLTQELNQGLLHCRQILTS